jgi:hypothetical protein
MDSDVATRWAVTFPKKSCSCPSSRTFHHTFACQLMLGLDPSDIGKYNLSRNNRKVKEWNSGSKQACKNFKEPHQVNTNKNVTYSNSPTYMYDNSSIPHIYCTYILGTCNSLYIVVLHVYYDWRNMYIKLLYRNHSIKFQTCTPQYPRSLWLISRWWWPNYRTTANLNMYNYALCLYVQNYLENFLVHVDNYETMKRMRARKSIWLFIFSHFPTYKMQHTFWNLKITMDNQHKFLYNTNSYVPLS